jgi:hypothetical protein
MKVSIVTPDSKIPNLAAMKISAWHKEQGDTVELNFPLNKADFTYASVLFDWTPDPLADLVGGSKYPESKLDPAIDSMKPDYSLYPNIDYSMGYTYKACPRTCDFCIVPKQKNDEKHYSIWDFHDPRFKKICLLNNNTLADLYWRDTFEEIIDAGLIVVDQNGYDARYITEEVADYFKRLRFQGYLHVAWDYMEHEEEVLKGICNLIKAGVKRIMCYIMIGHTTHEENLYRTLVLQQDFNIDPFVMPLNKHDSYQKSFTRWVNHKAIFKSVTWMNYKGEQEF